MIEFTKSLFYKVNFLPPVEVTQAQLEAWHTQDEETKTFIHEQFADPALQKAFSNPLTLIPDQVERIGRSFQGKNWRILSNKPVQGELKPYYSVLEHDGLPNKIVKHGGKRKLADEATIGFLVAMSGDFLEFDSYCSLLRIAMVERIQQIINESPDEFDGITLPEKKLCEIQSGRLQNHTLPIDQRFLIVAEKVDCLSQKETIDAIDKMSQQEQEALADKLVKLITKTGLADASFANIRLGKEEDVTQSGNRRVYLIDTEPSNVMILDQGWLKNFFAFQSSLEQAGRIGTVFFRFLEFKEWKTDSRAPYFVARIARHIQDQKSNKYSVVKIGLYFISVVALTAIYKKAYFGKHLKPYLKKYAETSLYKAISSFEIGRKTYIFAVLSPLEVGLVRTIGLFICHFMFRFNQQLILQNQSLSMKARTEQLLKDPWRQRALRFKGQGRM